MRILTLVVDLDTVRICESTNKGTVSDNRYNKLNTKYLSCTQGTFFRDFFDTINLEEIHGIFIFIVNEKYLQSYSHDLIQEILVGKDYYKLAMGNSIKTSNVNLDCMKYMFYCHSNFIPNFRGTKKFNYKIKKLTKGKYGVIGMSFNATFAGMSTKYNILCFCLPHDNHNKNYNITRAEKTLIIENTINKLIDRSHNMVNEKVILLGDFGYLLDIPKDQLSFMTLEDLYASDHLMNELNKHSYLKENNFIEGIDGKGINFFPTFKVTSNCNIDDLTNNDTATYVNKCLKESDSEIGWPIRTLYDVNTNILDYRVVTYGNIKELNNLGVYSIADV